MDEKYIFSMTQIICEISCIKQCCRYCDISFYLNVTRLEFWPVFVYEQVPLEKLTIVSPPLVQLQHTVNLEFGLNDGIHCVRLTLLIHSSWLWLVVSAWERCISANGNRTTGRSQRRFFFFSLLTDYLIFYCQDIMTVLTNM